MRLIDADKLESGELIIPTLYGGYEYVEVFYKDDVDNAPTVDAIKHGHWITDMGGCWCSVCNEYSDYSTDYCPNCGAKMNEVCE